MKQNAHLWIPAASIMAAILSTIFLSHIWFELLIQDRSFSSWLLLDILGCIPFLWPFLIGGALLSVFVPTVRVGAIAASGLGILGGLLYTRLSWPLLSDGDSLWDHPINYLRYFYPILFSLSGFSVGLYVNAIRSRTSSGDIRQVRD